MEKSNLKRVLGGGGGGGFRPRLRVLVPLPAIGKNRRKLVHDHSQISVLGISNVCGSFHGI